MKPMTLIMPLQKFASPYNLLAGDSITLTFDDSEPATILPPITVGHPVIFGSTQDVSNFLQGARAEFVEVKRHIFGDGFFGFFRRTIEITREVRLFNEGYTKVTRRFTKKVKIENARS